MRNIIQACYLFTLVWFLMVLGLTCSISRFVSSAGNDTFNDCSDRKLPCKSLQHAIIKSNENDMILVIDENNGIGTQLYSGNTSASNENKVFHSQNHANSIVITKSLHFYGVSEKSVLYIPTDRFAFIAGHPARQINITFKNFRISEESKHRVEKSVSCKPSSHGFIIVQGASVRLENCELMHICNAVNVVGRPKGVTGITVIRSVMKDVHYPIFSKNVSFLNLEFRETKVEGETDSSVPYYAISLIVKAAAVVHIVDCIFQSVNEAIAISMHYSKLIMKVSRCRFENNSGQSILLSFGSQANVNKSKVHFHNLTFFNNDGGYASSLHLIRSWSAGSRDLKPAPRIQLTGSLFKDNYAQAFFGAIYADGVELEIDDTLFFNNTAGNELSAIQAFGGAIFVESKTTVKVSNSSFSNNTCSGFGGAVFSRGQFSAVNCEFHGSAKGATRPLLGDILYVTAGLLLENTTWYPEKSYRTKSAIWHPGSPTLESWNIRIKGYFVVHCPVGHNITAHGLHRQPGMLTDRISMGCRSCPRNQYSLESGYLKLAFNKERVISERFVNVSCLWCRYGGICEQGNVRSRSNYYGYLSGEPKEVKFISCPLGYCCQGEDCISYSSCSPSRKGTLCGSCVEGSTENLLSANCVKKEYCKDKWFWFIYFPFGLIYISFFMYLDKIGMFLRGQFVWWENTLASVSEGSDVSEEAETCSDDEMNVEGDDDAVDDNSDMDVTEVGNTDYSRNEAGKEEPNTSDMLSDIVNITFYFYQMIWIIRDHNNSILTHTLALMKEISTSFFTFSLDSESTLSLCPFEGLTPVTKMFLVRSFPIYVITLLIAMNISIAMFRLFFRGSTRTEELSSLTIENPFSVRLRVTTIQIVLLTYSTITNMTMNFVNCVPVNGNIVLYMDGTIACFNWWQIIAFIFIALWIVPFPIALVLGISQLHHNKISYHRFLFCLAFPFCYAAGCFVFKAKDFIRKKIDRNITSDISKNERLISRSENDGYDVRIENTSVREILRRFEAPFKDDSRNNSKHEPGQWQGVMIIRRLIIIIMFTFINSPVTRLYCIFTACLLFLMHHLIYLPYKRNIVNVYETVSSATLVIFCSINMFFAYSYVSNVAPESADSRISLIFEWLEVLILVFFPLILLLPLSFFVVARILVTFYRVLRNSLNYLVNRN